MVYTSGTTGRPKGVVHSHRSVSNQVVVLRAAWGWRSADVLLNVLPQHHVHGLVNATLGALAAGACSVFAPFDAPRVAAALAAGDISVFMAVPAAYGKLMAAVERLPSAAQAAWQRALRRHVRLMVSGSSALPAAMHRRFAALSGHSLLERYGMTEVGMALAQPMDVAARQLGSVGAPLPTVEARVDAAGELFVRSPSVFGRYWGRPDATAAAFEAAADGLPWFATGDCAAATADGRAMCIRGRLSADILKVSGYKVSALEVEAALLRSGWLAEVAVMAVPAEQHADGSDCAVALCVPAVGDGGAAAALEDALRTFAATELSAAERPRRYVFAASIPRNAMGKVNKKTLAPTLASSPSVPSYPITSAVVTVPVHEHACCLLVELLLRRRLTTLRRKPISKLANESS
jgi:malonyl-CoA/methylmalonyl-CoA synthetase